MFDFDDMDDNDAKLQEQGVDPTKFWGTVPRSDCNPQGGCGYAQPPAPEANVKPRKPHDAKLKGDWIDAYPNQDPFRLVDGKYLGDDGTPGTAHCRPGAQPIALYTKVIFQGLQKVRPELATILGEIIPPGFDEEEKRYTVKVMNLSKGNIAVKGDNIEKVFVAPENIEIHPDVIEKERLAALESAVVLVGGDEAERAARAELYSKTLDPQHWYDKALERVFDAKHEFEVLDLEPKWYGEDMRAIKRQYRRISLAVHPDKNKHPQCIDGFRKVYGAFETLMDLKQQWRLLFVLDKLTGAEKDLYDLEAEEDEKFEWWWQASVPDMEKEAAEAEGAEFEEIGTKWISDGKGGNVDDVKWIGLSEALRLAQEGKVLFLDSRERVEYQLEHIETAHCVPMREFVDYGLQGVYGPWVKELMQKRNTEGFVIVIYSNVATPFSRCRALCRWMLRAGSSSLPAPLFRRLRGGLYGWRHKGGKIFLPIMDKDEIEKLKKAPRFTNIGNFKPDVQNIYMRGRIEWFKETSPHGDGCSIFRAADASGKVTMVLKDTKQKELVKKIAAEQGFFIINNARTYLHEGHMRARLDPAEGGTIEKHDKPFAIGFEAKDISADPYVPEPDQN